MREPPPSVPYFHAYKEDGDLEPLEVLELIRGASGAADISHVMLFKGWRDRADGQTKSITVEVRLNLLGDYFIIATDGDGRQATGNPNPNLRSALSGVHWDDLDRDKV